MLIEMSSPAFKEKGQERPALQFKKGLNVVLGKADGAMSIGKSSSLLAIDFVLGGNTYIKSNGVKQEGHHTIYFAFQFESKNITLHEILRTATQFIFAMRITHLLDGDIRKRNMRTG